MKQLRLLEINSNPSYSDPLSQLWRKYLSLNTNYKIIAYETGPFFIREIFARKLYNNE